MLEGERWGVERKMETTKGLRVFGALGGIGYRRAPLKSYGGFAGIHTAM